MNLKKNPASNWKLYSIIDKNIIKHKDPVKVALRLFEGGVDVVQLRYKNWPSYELLRIAKGIQNLADRYKKTLLINDRIDVALASGSRGTHLGSGDISVRAARLILGPKSVIGKTVHKIREAKKAGLEKPDYLSAGPVFSTPLKKNLKGQGIDFVKKIKKRAGQQPVFAIGGINKRNVKAVLKSGADGICVTRAMFEAKRILKEINPSTHPRPNPSTSLRMVRRNGERSRTKGRDICSGFILSSAEG